MAHVTKQFQELLRWGYTLKTPEPIQEEILQETIQTYQTRPALQENDETDLHFESLEALNKAVKICSRCSCAASRKQVVVGSGSAKAEVMVLGSVPGPDEDSVGLPFFGAAGEFLDKWLEAIGLNRYKNVFMTYPIKCRPPEGKRDLQTEARACFPYLREQIQKIQPKALLAIGLETSDLLNSQFISGNPKEYGAFWKFMDYPCMTTYHPGLVLRDPRLKRAVWEDLKKFKELL